MATEKDSKSESSSVAEGSVNSESQAEESGSSDRDHSPVREYRKQLREHIKNGKIRPSSKNALLIFTPQSTTLTYCYLIPASELKLGHLELFQCWTHCKNIYTDSDAYVPEYLAYLETDVREFLLERWLKYRDDAKVLDLEGNTLVFRIRAIDQ